MATLRQISDEIANALERPFDEMFKARVKAIFRHELAVVIRQELNKTGQTDAFTTSFIANLTVVDKSPLHCGDKQFCTDILPSPIRYSTGEIVGAVFRYNSTTKKHYPYIYTKKAELPYVDLTKAYIDNPPRYIYDNLIICVIDSNLNVDNPTGNECILIEGAYNIVDIFDDTEHSKLNNKTFNDDTVLPIPEDIIQMIKLRLLQGELSIIDEKNKIQPTHIDNN